MKPFTYLLLDLFGASQRYVIPIYQRRYVWTKDRQWAPLWQDVRSRTEKVLACSRTLVSLVPLLPLASPSTPHQASWGVHAISGTTGPINPS